MSIDVDCSVSVRCDGCHKRTDESGTVNHCHACEDKRKAQESPARGGEIRAWADRQKLLGFITHAEADFLERVARDIDLLPPRKAA